jgi:carbohydrate diacid regulator
MKILEHIAQDIAEKTSEVLKYPISITDNEGYIIGSTDKSRIGIFHQPSLEVIKNNRLVNCKNEIRKKILPGVSVPIRFDNLVIGVLGIVGDPLEVEKYVQLVRNQVEMMCLEAFRKETVELKEKMIEVFVHQLLYLQESEETNHIIQYSKLLDYDLQTDHICLLIQINSISQKIASTTLSETFSSKFPFQYFQREMLNFLHLLFHESKNDLISFLTIEHFVVIKSIPSKISFSNLKENMEQKIQRLNTFLKTKYKVSACISVGDVGSGISGIAESYNNAKEAMNEGMKEKHDTSVFFYNERETLLRLLSKELPDEYKKKLVKTISNLTLRENYEVLSHTFKMFCKYNMNLSEAARNMFIHRNTIIYRLEKINVLTSLDTSTFEHCMLLHAAIQCYEETKMS